MRKIVKYKNRKLYDTSLRKNITLKELSDTLNPYDEIQIIEHKTEKDITYKTLLSLLTHRLKNANIKSIENLLSMINTIN